MTKLPWRVRVNLKQETWIEVVAETAAEAEAEARNRPNVLSVIGGTTIRGDKLADRDSPISVEEDLFWSNNR